MTYDLQLPESDALVEIVTAHKKARVLVRLFLKNKTITAG